MRKATFTMLASTALALASMTAATADAGYSTSATPTTGLKSGDVVTLTVNGLSGSLGVYASVCQAGASPMSLPSICDQASTVWITSGAVGSVTSPARITVQAQFAGKASPSATTSTDVNCVAAACVLYIRADHNNFGNFSLIRTIPLTFTSGGTVRSPDTATAQYGSTTLRPNQAGQLSYRTPIMLKVKPTSGLRVTLTSLTPDCTVSGNMVTALKGAGVCAIAATTKGSFQFTPLSVNFPFYLTPATQTIKAKWPKPASVKKGTSIFINSAAFVSNMEQPVSLATSSPNCTVSSTADGWTVNFTATGTCNLNATADLRADKWTSASASTTYSVR